MNIERIILDNIPYLAWFKDNDGKYLHVNELLRVHIVIHPEEIIGKTDFDLCSYEKALEFQRTDEEVKQYGKATVC